MIKQWMRAWLVRKLGIYAKRRLASAPERPNIIAITGSVGKSSLREAITTVLSPSLTVLSTKQNYNTEIGVPLVILELDTADSSWIGWLSVLRRAKHIAQKPWMNAPDVIVLEFGIDHPGDMDVLRSLVTPDIAVVGPIPDPPVHGKFFMSSEHLAKEKGKIARGLSGSSMVVEADGYPFTRLAVKSSDHKRVVNYGRESSDVSVVEREIILHESGFAVRGVIRTKDKSHTVMLPGHVALHVLDTVAASIAVAQALPMNVAIATSNFASLGVVSRRLEHKQAASGVHVLDDTYNASPGAVIASLEILSQLPLSGRKVAILGTMRELDPAIMRQAHVDIARKAKKLGCELVAIGEFANDMARAADGRVFASAEEILNDLRQKSLTRQDAVLFKASNSLKLSDVVDAYVTM